MAVEQAATADRTAGPGIEPAPRWLIYAFAACSAAMIPWTIWLYNDLPSRATADNWDVAWAGFDVAIAAALLATALGAWRCRTWTQSAAACAATLLVCDAWFDVMTSRTPHQMEVALLMALLAEVPLAIVCLWVGLNTERVTEWSLARRRRG